VARAVTDTLGAEYFAEDWGQLNQALFSALWIEKMAIGITIGLIMMVAALNIVASLVLLVMEKSRDIAILKTMGASSGSIRTIFVLQGGIIGVVGTAVGAACGVAVSHLADRYQLIRLPGDVYSVAWLPFRVEPSNFLLVVLGSLAVCLLATLYPSRQASRLDPAEALRYQ
jgi:lipoprotein-releasing system permease protein